MRNVYGGRIIQSEGRGACVYDGGVPLVDEVGRVDRPETGCLIVPRPGRETSLSGNVRVPRRGIVENAGADWKSSGIRSVARRQCLAAGQLIKHIVGLPLPLAGLLNDQGHNAAECLNGRGGSTKSRKALGSSWRTTGSLARTIDANKICVVAGRGHGYVWNES